MNSELSLPYSDFKYILKFKKHLTYLSLNLINKKLKFKMIYNFYDYFWNFVHNLTKPFLIEKDFDKMENLVD